MRELWKRKSLKQLQNASSRKPNLFTAVGEELDNFGAALRLDRLTTSSFPHDDTPYRNELLNAVGTHLVMMAKLVINHGKLQFYETTQGCYTAKLDELAAMLGTSRTWYLASGPRVDAAETNTDAELWAHLRDLVIRRSRGKLK